MARQMAERLAGDIMIPVDKYPHVNYRATLRDAIKEIRKLDIDIAGRTSLPRAILVFDDDNNLLGIVRRRDIFKGLEPKFLRSMSTRHRQQMFDVEVDPNLIDLTSGRVEKAVQEQAELPVLDVMQLIAATVDFNDNLAKIVYIMLSRDLALLPVLKDRKVVGVVRSVDVFDDVADIVG